MSSTLERSIFMGKNYSENLRSCKNTVNNLTMKQMFAISEKLIVGQSDEIYEVNPLTGKILCGNNHLWSVMKKSSVSRTRRFTYFQICVMPWRDESEPNIKFCLGRQVELVQKFTTRGNFGHN